MIYRVAFDAVISKLDPEQCHEAAIAAMDIAGRIPGVPRLVRGFYGRGIATQRGAEAVAHSPALARHFARPVPSALGVAAGLDKDARAVSILSALGFGFVEVGTVTPKPQPGNERPRLWRLLDERGIRNQMGFNNDGAEAMRERLRKLRSTPAGRRLIIGVNIGKNKTTPAANAVADYVTCARTLARYADYLVVNVSSPNTPGLRDLQAVDQLRPILTATLEAAREAAGRCIPVLVKIAPDLADDDIAAVAALVREAGLAGVVATNTTIAHDFGSGGVSGPRLRQRALDVVAALRDRLGDDYVIIGCGGISDRESAQALMDAGADLVEELTAFIYAGPSQPAQIARGLTSRRA
ncbi:quinone-dependent dihydroorotate dehydrogenase [Nanchangia anserum]|uniref:Dihydroorotate dehydrogenase (quinone) n=1 Tax=Nanchangia anserum TaxID=2692125 RepID=A0A8I0GB11_9ACTO|nr:quinone-dependent dihydroorotate dehydrogenase [Nanchangia anserum]MBD3688855.1 quinone-dependent dihydroorotate dehydrogenase [Nanchangia anserum]QOX81127.1 quinone-dependent dihydroorotate dehydrogenase [Nanchangia anserum]